MNQNNPFCPDAPLELVPISLDCEVAHYYSEYHFHFIFGI